jgi:hypothetical protein
MVKAKPNFGAELGMGWAGNARDGRNLILNELFGLA